MDRRSWLWRRKSSEKSPGETESSGSLSSLSERYSDEQEVSRFSPNHAQSPDVSSKVAVCEDHDTVKELTKKLSDALLNIEAKEDLVQQHVKVAEEAVSGWEKAELEVAALKQQLETVSQKNSTLELRIGQLDGALKECIWQLRQAREEQEQKVHNAIVEKRREWDGEKSELENRLVEVESQLEATKEEASAFMNPDIQLKLEEVEKENNELKRELQAQSEKLRVQTLERDLSIQAAETASKQRLESIKKVAKLESECRTLRANARKTVSYNDHRPLTGSVYSDSLADSQSEIGERILAVDNELSCSDQFKKEKNFGTSMMTSSLEIDLMDDFIEMEKLAAMPDFSHSDNHVSEFTGNSEQTGTENSSLKAKLESALRRTAELEEKVERMESEKAELENVLAETRERLELSSNQLKEAEDKLLELERKLDSANASKQDSEMAAKAAEAKREELESQLEAADAEVQQLCEQVCLLEEKAEKEKTLAEEFATKCQKLEDELSKKRESEVQRSSSITEELKVKQEKELATAAGKFAECQRTIASIGWQLKSLANLEDILLESEKIEESSPDGEARKLSSGGSPEANGDPSSLPNEKERRTTPSSSLSGFQSLPIIIGPVV